MSGTTQQGEAPLSAIRETGMPSWFIHFGKGDSIMAELQNLEDAMAKIEADAANIATNVQATRDEVAALTQQVADLQAQIDAGTAATPEQLQALADRANAIDASLDAIVPTP